MDIHLEQLLKQHLVNVDIFEFICLIIIIRQPILKKRKQNDSTCSANLAL